MIPGIGKSIAIASGKGGVGKSTISLNLALALANQGASVALLDADVYGPDIPLMVNLTRRSHATHWTLAGDRSSFIQPVETHGISIMSSGFLIAEDQGLAWDSNLVQFLIWQLINRVQWGEKDFLVIDLPPGTADLQQTFVKDMLVDGAVIVVTPQDVAHLDAKKTIAMFQNGGIPILGAIENMAGLACPHCDQLIDVFSRVPEERSIWAAGIHRLGALPFDPALSASADKGTPLMHSQPKSAVASAITEIARQLSVALAS